MYGDCRRLGLLEDPTGLVGLAIETPLQSSADLYDSNVKTIEKLIVNSA